MAFEWPLSYWLDLFVILFSPEREAVMGVALSGLVAFVLLSGYYYVLRLEAPTTRLAGLEFAV